MGQKKKKRKKKKAIQPATKRPVWPRYVVWIAGLLLAITAIVFTIIGQGGGAEMTMPVVTIEMEGGGVIKVELDPENAPNTVNNFIYLAEQGYYDGLIFHRVIDGFMIQGGCPQGTGTGGPGYRIRGEFAANGFENELIHERGVISMARSDPFDSAGSQFFIMVAKQPHLDGKYAAFGRVIEGMDEVDRISLVDRTPHPYDRPLEDQRIKTITVEKFGQEFDPPEKQ